MSNLKKIFIDVKYEIGEEVQYIATNEVFIVIGYEHIPEKWLRYICIEINDYEYEWRKFHDFELKQGTK